VKRSLRNQAVAKQASGPTVVAVAPRRLGAGAGGHDSLDRAAHENGPGVERQVRAAAKLKGETAQLDGDGEKTRPSTELPVQVLERAADQPLPSGCPVGPGTPRCRSGGGRAVAAVEGRFVEDWTVNRSRRGHHDSDEQAESAGISGWAPTGYPS